MTKHAQSTVADRHATMTGAELRAAALHLYDAGFTVLPTEGKKPTVRWKAYQTARPTRAQVEEWFPATGDIAPGLALLTGTADGLEMTELEGRVMDRWGEVEAAMADHDATELWERLNTGWVERSPSGGVHWFYRLASPVPSSVKIAQRPGEPDDNGRPVVEVLAETRGRGGYTVAAPTGGHHHETGHPWARIGGGPATAATLTLDERAKLHAVLRHVLDDMPESAARPAPPARTPYLRTVGEVTPLDEYNAAADWADILQPEGWTYAYTGRDGTRYWFRPGKDRGQISATTDRPNDAGASRLYVFSTSTTLEANTPHSKAFVYAHYHHGDNMSAAAKALRAQDYGTPRSRQDTARETVTVLHTNSNAKTAPVERDPDPDPDADPEATTSGQLRMAYRFARTNTGRFLHVDGLGWLKWTGTHWAEDGAEKAATRAIYAVLKAAFTESFHDERLRKDVQKCQSAAGVAGVLKLASVMEGVEANVNDLDAHPDLLNVANGTLDLRTLDLRPHNPADRITRVTRGAYVPDAPGIAWASFLAQSLPDRAVQGFLQRYVGQALCGRIVEQRLPILTGQGGNGKSVWFGAVNHTLGSYALTPQADMLLAKRNRTAFDGSVELRGRRWAVFSEVNEGATLDPETVKRLTGNDEITARGLYQKNITFPPTWSLAMVANHKPEISDTSHAMWRRVAVVPFEVVIPEAEQDRRLPAKLHAEADAVLTWAVRGWQDYQQQGLNDPETVRVATDAYRNDNDQITRFLAECTQQLPGTSATTTQLHAEYQQWCLSGNGGERVGSKAFSQALKDRGLRQGTRREWLGRCIRPDWRTNL